MKSLSVFAKDLGAAVRNKKILIPIIAVLFIPVMYSGMFLGAFWDPYGKMEDLPVAVVNNDQGAVFEGKTLQAGDDLVAELKKGKILIGNSLTGMKLSKACRITSTT